jgi:ABC-2 type transport system permease protein
MKTLFFPLISSLRNRFFPHGHLPLRTAAILLFGLILFSVLYLVSLKVIGYFHLQNELGIILSLKIFQMAWAIMFTMLIFSTMVSGISALFLSNDNEILCAAPVSPGRLYWMRFISTILYTSWMMLIFSLPIFGAYGTVFHAGVFYWPLLLLSVFSTAAMAGGIGLAVTIALVNIFPARRTKDIVVYLSLLFGILLYLVIRLIRPEDLADPEKFPDFLEYLSAMQAPATPLLPPSWPSNLLCQYLQDGHTDILLTLLLILTPCVFYFTGEWIMEQWFIKGYSKAQESFGGFHTFKAKAYHPLPMRWFFRRELHMFLRDSSEWSQLFLVGALIVVYLYNFKALPLDRSPMPVEYISNLISYANIGLTGFLVASLSARFVYPSIGSEGSGFALILTSPLTTSRYILYKYLFYVIPFSCLALILLLVSNSLLQISGPMQWISVGTGLIITWSVVALALGFGALYADFKAENRAAVQGGFGAILFLFSSLSLELTIIGIGSVPAYQLVRTVVKTGEAPMMLTISSLLMLLVMLTGALWVSLRCVKKGITHLEEG